VDDRKDWTQWLEAAGVHGVELAHGPVLNRVTMAIDAAVDGQGIVLARTTLAATDLINGRLLRPFAEELRLSKTYWIICPKATTTLPPPTHLATLNVDKVVAKWRRTRLAKSGASC